MTYSSGAMIYPVSPGDRQFNVYMALNQYPILSDGIRARMRRELFERGIITLQHFEADARAIAIQSQGREGLSNPYGDEAPEVWEYRLGKMRDLLTDQIFSRNLSFELFEQLVWEVLSERGVNAQQHISLSMNPELAPLEVVFDQAMMIENMPDVERSTMQARLVESKVVLIRTLISDQLRYINVAKEWFTISDLADIRRRKLGTGRIGGKAAGMLLALRILETSASPLLKDCLRAPDSYFIGSDVFYTFMSTNNLFHWNDQKYKSEAEMRVEYPMIIRDFEASEFPLDFLGDLSDLLENMGKKPLIVRSSSLLEDNFGTAFAGKYESVFLPNQGNSSANLGALTRALIRVYVSTLNPNALLYRRSKGLQDYDERMGVLIQVVEGETFGKYYLPQVAGVAFSRNLYRWAPQIRREDGFARLVWGLGTRAVDRVGNDYPRLLALSHPLLRPSTDATSIRRYSQQYVDLIDLEKNSLLTLPIRDVLSTRYPSLRYLVQVEEDGYFSSLRSSVFDSDMSNLVLTFEDLLRRTDFASQLRLILQTLEKNYNSPVDLEFTLKIINPVSARPQVAITILQCRPQSFLVVGEQATLPMNLPEGDVIFSTQFVVPEGVIHEVRYVVYVPAEGYFSLQSKEDRYELVRAVSRLNNALKDEKFICVGPGRWGSSNSDLGVSVDYGDIYNTEALVELSGSGIGPAPEPSLGTHFFQDLLEEQIYPLAIPLGDENSSLNRNFFDEMPNRVREWTTLDEKLMSSLRLIAVDDYRKDHYIRIVMSDEKSRAIAYLQKDSQTSVGK